MDREVLLAIVKRSDADTLIAQRFREALKLPARTHRGLWRDRSAKSRKYRDARSLMMQRHGVWL